MKTPIYDFVHDYSEKHPLRMHMPGHKGGGPLGVESLDITEIAGADSLYEASGIIRESEKNAGSLFGCETFYSAEGSSLCIRAMLYLAVVFAKSQGRKPHIAAGRNAHKTFLSAAALLDFEISWIYPVNNCYLSCKATSEAIEELIESSDEKPTAIYITSPDYLGGMTDIAAISQICRKNNMLLLVDNAHGAYLKFLPESKHPIDLGADMCCDSAHKTLPVLTGGAYLHISDKADSFFKDHAKSALSLFGSTSPSYLILQSLDVANRYISENLSQRLYDFCEKAYTCKKTLRSRGFEFYGDEPIKFTIRTKSYGYYGYDFANILFNKNIVCEFSDPDFTVMMLTPEIGEDGLLKLEQALCSIPQKPPIIDIPPAVCRNERAISVRNAVLSPSETVPSDSCCGRVLSSVSVGCPPAVPIAVSGERLSEQAVKCFKYYGIKSCEVVKEISFSEKS